MPPDTDKNIKTNIVFYNFFIFFYNIGVAVAAMFSKKVRTMWRGEHDTWAILREQLQPTEQYIWFHAASLGEFEQGRPLMEQIRKEHPGVKILLSFFSPSGYEVRKDYKGADIICYLPIDTPLNALHFIRMVNPSMAFFIKYEFWANYLHVLQQRGVPVYSVSSIFRPRQIFFRWYGHDYAKVLKCFTRLFVQNEESRQLLHGIGIDNVDVVGDTRFDRVLQIKEAAKVLPLVRDFVGETKKVFVAGSSWLPDEEIFIPYFNAHKDWKLIVAPHVIGEAHLRQIMKLLEGRSVTRYTEATPESAANADVLIIDCFGLLSSIYQYGSVSYVGGGFGVGIHNTLEAAVWGMPVIFGPNNKRFREAQGLLQAQGGFEINSADDFADIMGRLDKEDFLSLSGQKAAAYVAGLAGATGKVLSKIRIR